MRPLLNGGTLGGLRASMNWVKRITDEVEPIRDSIYGSLYRCSLTLKDGTFLPCSVIQSKARLVELAKRRIREELAGRGRLGGADPYGQIVESFVAKGNNVNDYDVASASPSRFAIPVSLLSQIRGETTMSWTGWVFRMRDGRCFSYGSSFLMEFFHLPDGYDFSDVTEVINHSFVSGHKPSTRRNTASVVSPRRDPSGTAVFLLLRRQQPLAAPCTTRTPADLAHRALRRHRL
jgi:hypothetical protein